MQQSPNNTTNMQHSLEIYIEMARSFASMTYQGVYLVDLDSGHFLFMSESKLLRHGLTDEEVLKEDLRFLSRFVPEDKMELLGDISKVVLSGYVELPQEVRPKMMLYLNFHIRHEGELVMVCHKLRMLNFDDEGRPHILLGLLSPSPASGPVSIMASIPNTNFLYTCDAVKLEWKPVTPIHLTPNELTMLRLAMQGYSMERIGELMFRSPDTVKHYRRQVFSKMHVRNISEAIAFALHYGLI